VRTAYRFTIAKTGRCGTFQVIEVLMLVFFFRRSREDAAKGVIVYFSVF
jgi:hypothetical protein